MEKLVVAIVGLGLGRQFLAAVAEANAVGRIIVCDPDAARAADARAAFPSVTAAYPDIGTMLDAARPDAVVVVTPDHLHRPHVEQCLRAGCHVLVTKPIATNLDDARAIVRAAEGAGRAFMVAHERRFRTRIRAIKAMLEGGELGEVIHLRIDAIQDKRGQFARSPWYASTEAGRTALVGSGIHEVDLVRHLVGRRLESVAAFSNRLGSLSFPKDKTTAALFRFEGGAVGQVTVTYEAHWPKAGAIDDHFRLVATGGIIVGDRVARDGRDDWKALPRERNEMVASVKGCVDAFLRGVVDGAPVPVTGREAFASLAAAVAADESAATGRSVTPAPSDF